MIVAAGVDSEGRKHVLGIQEGATENATVVAELLEDIVSRGVDPNRKMLFVIDGSKAPSHARHMRWPASARPRESQSA
jgi:transposase-like protein